jgi:hypothetical protein
MSLSTNPQIRYWNTYPGCACDVPSHLYSLSYELNPDWSHSFSPQHEIHNCNNIYPIELFLFINGSLYRSIESSIKTQSQ